MMSNASKTGELALFLFQVHVAAKMLHWQTTSYAVHKATDALAERIQQLTDTLMEQIMGTYGRPKMAGGATIEVPNMTKGALVSLLRQGMEYLSSAGLPRDTHIQNTLDEVKREMATTLYLLTQQ